MNQRPQNNARMSNIKNLQDSSQEKGFSTTNTSGFDEYSSSEQHRLTLINRSRDEVRRTFREEFPRCTASSSSSNKDSNSNSCESDFIDPRDSLSSRKMYIKTQDFFRGTGQNGQILKEDVVVWSRRLHNKIPPDLYQN